MPDPAYDPHRCGALYDCGEQATVEVKVVAWLEPHYLIHKDPQERKLLLCDKHAAGWQNRTEIGTESPCHHEARTFVGPGGIPGTDRTVCGKCGVALDPGFA